MTGSEADDASSLFRKEAVEAATDRLGRPIGKLGVSSWVLTAFMVVVVLTVFCFLALGSYTRKETVQGRIFIGDGVPRIASVRSGLVESVLVKQGQTVRKGQTLLTVATDAMTPDGRHLSDALGDASEDKGVANLADLAAQRERSAHDLQEIQAKQGGLNARIGRLKKEIVFQRERVALSEVTVRDLLPLKTSQQISAIQYRQYQSALLDAKQGLSSLERELESAQAELNELGAAARSASSDARSLEARIDAEAAGQKERKTSLDGDRHYALTSPVDGVVTALTAQVGTPVAPNATLAVVVPNKGAYQVELWVPSRAIGFVKPGQEARLMFDAFPFERFGFGRGHVISVSTAPTPAADLVGIATSPEPLYRVQVSLESTKVRAYGKEWPLSPGMQLSADLVLEKRSFLDWLLDPLRAASLRS